MSDPFQKSMHRTRRLPVIAAMDRVRRPSKPTPENPLIFSVSELSTWLRCRVKWSWRYHHKLERMEKSEPLAVGSLGHMVLEHWYKLDRKERTLKAMKKIAKRLTKGTNPDELSLENLQLIEAMCVGYAAWARPRDREIRIRDCKPEVWFDEPLTADGAIRVRGKIDAIFRVGYLKSTMGAFEHKFMSQIRVSNVDLNHQLTVYLWVLRRLHPKKKRFIAYYNILRKQMPGPRVKADLFAREPVERSADEIAQWEIDAQRAALDMIDGAIYPNPMEACAWDCDFQIPCLLRGRPDDLSHVLKTHFKPKEYR